MEDGETQGSSSYIGRADRSWHLTFFLTELFGAALEIWTRLERRKGVNIIPGSF